MSDVDMEMTAATTISKKKEERKRKRKITFPSKPEKVIEHVDCHWFMPAYYFQIATCAVCGKRARKEYDAVYDNGSYLCSSCASKKVEECLDRNENY